MAGERPVLLGLLRYFLIAAAPTLLFWAALRVLPAVAGAVGERRRRRDASSRSALAATDVIEAQVANLRRLRRDAPIVHGSGGDRAFARLITEAALEGAGIALDPPVDGTAAA
jgi:hypothetical protein